jgi:hypothetical protein
MVNVLRFKRLNRISIRELLWDRKKKILMKPKVALPAVTEKAVAEKLTAVKKTK